MGIRSEYGRRILGEFGEAMPRGKSRGELLPIKRSTQQLSLECEVLPDHAEARLKCLRAIRQTDPAHAPFAFPGWLVTRVSSESRSTASEHHELLRMLAAANRRSTIRSCCWRASSYVAEGSLRHAGNPRQCMSYRAISVRRDPLCPRTVSRR